MNTLSYTIHQNTNTKNKIDEGEKNKINGQLVHRKITTELFKYL